MQATQRSLATALLLTSLAFGQTSTAEDINSLSDAEDKQNFKLLFDVYHVSIMNGDIIRRIRQYKDYIGHYHTAGNPGRGELDDHQEINYPAVMREIVKTGFKGFVAHEFIPTWKDPVAALRHGVQVCDVS